MPLVTFTFLKGQPAALKTTLGDVMVSFQETAWENWSFANGHILHK